MRIYGHCEDNWVNKIAVSSTETRMALLVDISLHLISLQTSVDQLLTRPKKKILFVSCNGLKKIG